MFAKNGLRWIVKHSKRCTFDKNRVLWAQMQKHSQEEQVEKPLRKVYKTKNCKYQKKQNKSYVQTSKNARSKKQGTYYWETVNGEKVKLRRRKGQTSDKDRREHTGLNTNKTIEGMRCRWNEADKTQVRGNKQKNSWKREKLKRKMHCRCAGKADW